MHTQFTLNAKFMQAHAQAEAAAAALTAAAAAAESEGQSRQQAAPSVASHMETAPSMQHSSAHASHGSSVQPHSLQVASCRQGFLVSHMFLPSMSSTAGHLCSYLGYFVACLQ